MTVNDKSKANLIRFAKNDGEIKDPRINRRGRAIRKADDLTKAWQDVWSEILFDSNGVPIIDEVTGQKLTRLKAQMRAMTTSNDPRKIQMALDRSYGKVKEQLDVTSNGETLNITVKIAGDGS